MRKILVVFCFAAFLSQPAVFSQTETTLHNFAGAPTDGANPLGDLLFDSTTGLVYGTTNKGGASTLCSKGCGTVFSIAPDGSSYSVIYEFAGGTGDGANPQAGLVIDSSGNFYGTTYNGGLFGFGTVFKLAPAPAGGFTETILYAFTGGNDGSHPLSQLVLDSSGNLYGTTFEGGSKKRGAVFELTPSGVETVLYAFTATNDGEHPRAGVVFDASGNLWGTTSQGVGTAKLGAVFKLVPVSGVWTENFLFPFTGPNGSTPYARVTIDDSGNVFGTTKFGGTPTCSFTASGCGVVFELTPSDGGYIETPIYSFTGSAGDGAEPLADLTLALDNGGYEYLFGTASEAGTLGGTCPATGCGMAFELCGVGSECAGASTWTEYTILDFAGKIGGRNPAAGMIVFLPVGDDPDLDKPSTGGHSGCTSGCMVAPPDGGTSGDGTVDSTPGS
jgi:uncharacterized repeat protein (TIGR03803 family)